MMKNDHFYWKKWLGPQHKVFNSIFLSFHGVIVNYPNTLVLTSALQVMHIHVTLIYFHHQGYNISFILSLLLHFDTVADMTL